MGLIYLNTDNQDFFKSGIEAIESEAEYPLGEDFFKIDHGKDYFAFFKQLGKLSYCVWTEKGRIAAVAASVLRKVPLQNKMKSAWYLCDLKVHPQFRGQKIPLKMPLALVHAQFGPLGQNSHPDVIEGATHMFCAPSEDELTAELKAMGLLPSASATVISHRMNGTDWSWVLTNEI